MLFFNKHTLLLSGLLLCAFIVFGSAQLAKSARAVFFDTSHQFYISEPHAKMHKLRHSFNFLNIGFKPLSILSVKSFCGCTVASYSKVIEPWGIGEVNCEMTLGPDDTMRNVELLCTTNEDGERLHRLVLNAVATGQYRVSPPHLDLGKVVHGFQPVTDSFLVTMPSSGIIDRIYDSENAFEFDCPVQEPGYKDSPSVTSIMKVQMRLKEAEDGDFHSNIFVLFRDGNRLSLPVRWTVSPERGFSLDEISFGVLRADRPSKATVRFYDFSSFGDLASANVWIDSDWCSISHVQVEEKGILRIDLVAKNSAYEKGRLHATLILECSDRSTFQLPMSSIAAPRKIN